MVPLRAAVPFLLVYHEALQTYRAFSGYNSRRQKHLSQNRSRLRTRRTERPPLIESSRLFLAWCLVHRSLILQQQQQHQPPPPQQEEEDMPPKCCCVRPNVAAAVGKHGLPLFLLRRPGKLSNPSVTRNRERESNKLRDVKGAITATASSCSSSSSS